ncbi:hypothetical protein ARMSODRAFT_947478 [Armillaria solidipes]|uniref:Uncharacterized protein n=1 Tax=Armillaria solidipes TaxID=1076256 RepID=A0A2H3CQY4_9AGAR|nr:hypothetical protein ARMSODRAFT_947478 [Armillaria solidipes]
MAANTPKDSIDLSSPALQQLWNDITTKGIAFDRDLRKCGRRGMGAPAFSFQV